jgi:hypothetical protein
LLHKQVNQLINALVEKEEARPSLASLVQETHEPATQGSLALALRPQNHSIEKIGCAFIDSTYYFLEYLKCPSDVRDVILCISGLSGGNYISFSKMTQDQIGLRMGLNRDSVRRKLAALWTWQQKENRTAIEIKQGEYDHVTKKYGVTEYRPLIVYFAAEYIRRVAQKGLRPIPRQQAITEKTEEVFEDIAEEIAEDMPEAPMLVKRKERNVTPPQVRLNFIESREERVVRAFVELRDALVSQRDPKTKEPVYPLQKAWEEVLVKAEQAFFS